MPIYNRMKGESIKITVLFNFFLGLKRKKKIKNTRKMILIIVYNECKVI